MTSMSFSLQIARLDPVAGDLSGVACPACRGSLVFHQPDARLPDRLIATCETCPAWFLLDAAFAVLIRLPDQIATRTAGSAMPSAS